MTYEDIETCCICKTNEHLRLFPNQKDLLECQNCGYVFNSPRLTQEEIVHFYSQLDQYDSWLVDLQGRDAMWKRRLKLILPHLNITTSTKLLDVGTGIGQFLHNAKQYFGKICGTEVSESAISIAKEKFKLDIINGSLDDINFSENKFNVITLFHVLEHVPNPRETLEKCWELLEDKGTIVIAVPNDVDSILHIIRDKIKSTNRFNPTSEIHLSHFRMMTLQKMLENCGYNIIYKGLDKHWSNHSLIMGILYIVFIIFYKLFRKNLYMTTLIIAQKNN